MDDDKTAILQTSTTQTVSVVIPAYNAEQFLPRAVRSAIKQTKPPLEILIVDDASTDNTLSVARSLGTEYPSVSVLALEVNGGPAAARNAGFDVAKGDWIAVLDADDAFMPFRLEQMESAYAKLSADIVVDNLYFYDATDAVIKSTAIPAGSEIEPFDVYDFVAHARPYTGQSDWGLLQPMFRRRFLLRENLRYPISSRHGEDFLLMFKALHAGGKALLSRTPGYLYSTRDSGMSRTTIDYPAMIQHTRELLAEGSIRSDARLLRLLNKRIIALRRWCKELKLGKARRDKNYIAVASLVASDPWLAFRSIQLVFGKITKVLSTVN